MKKRSAPTPQMISLFAVALCFLMVASYFAGYWVSSNHYEGLFSSFTPVRERGDTYPLIAPLLAYGIPEATQFGQYISLDNLLEQQVAQASTTGDAPRVSVYFRDLNTSDWIGVNQNFIYYPASLLKVPVLIAYYKEAEQDPSTLHRSIMYETLAGADPFDAPSTLVPGQSYTVEQLIDSMIIDSDNGATQTLLNYIDPHRLDEVYGDLGVSEPGNDSSTYQISTHTYALFFRVLYNATYLDPEYSQKALALLSKATFAQGLVAGLPAGTDVAHKFGEHVLTQGKVAVGVELHDCGIVYYPNHPYLLCVMTSAKDVTTAYSIIKNISSLTYAAIQQKYGSQ